MTFWLCHTSDSGDIIYQRNLFFSRNPVWLKWNEDGSVLFHSYWDDIFVLKVWLIWLKMRTGGLSNHMSGFLMRSIIRKRVSYGGYPDGIVKTKAKHTSWRESGYSF